MSAKHSYRSQRASGPVVGLSISYQRNHLLSRGMGLEHLREMLVRLTRRLLRQQARLAYGGHWKETEDNFTFDLLHLISAEQADDLSGVTTQGISSARLFNHSPWPGYLAITPAIEARWINCCRVVRITQQLAGLSGVEIVADAEANSRTDRALFNAAVTLSAMRQRMMEPLSIPIPEVPTPETIPPIEARVAMGGRVEGFSGFLPGLFEEAMATLERGRPLFIIGGFGGAAEVLARTILGDSTEPLPELTETWHLERNPDLARLLKLTPDAGYRLPDGVRRTSEALSGLFDRLRQARSNPARVLNTGLSDTETRALLTTRDMALVVKLVWQGLDRALQLEALPA